jgi:DNA-binding NtrC family response regulator
MSMMSQTSRASPFNLRQALSRFERGYIENILTLAEGDVTRAAQMLEIRPNALLRKLRADQREDTEQPPPGVSGQTQATERHFVQRTRSTASPSGN